MENLKNAGEILETRKHNGETMVMVRDSVWGVNRVYVSGFPVEFMGFDDAIKFIDREPIDAVLMQDHENVRMLFERGCISEQKYNIALDSWV